MCKISVIIPTRNRAQSLGRTLSTIARQTLPQDDFEVIVVDNGSTDRTGDVVQRARGTLKQLRYEQDERPGLHVGRHRGMTLAKSELLVYCDDDVDASPNWLEGISVAFQDSKVALVGGPVLPVFESAVPGWILRLWRPGPRNVRVCGALSIVDLGPSIQHVSPHFVFGCNFSIRKSILDSIGGFHPDGMPRELIKFRGDGETHVAEELVSRGHVTCYTPKASVGHVIAKNRLSRVYFRQRAYDQGISDSFTLLRRTSRPSSTHGMALYFYGKLRYYARGLGWSPFSGLVAWAGLRGFQMHQAEYTRNKVIRDWVHQEHYRDKAAVIPKLAV